MLCRIFPLYFALSMQFSCSGDKLEKEDSRRISSILDASRRFYKVLCSQNMSHHSSVSPTQLAVPYAQVFLVWTMKCSQLGENTMYGLFGMDCLVLLGHHAGGYKRWERNICRSITHM
jgi:hypothetical protein